MKSIIKQGSTPFKALPVYWCHQKQYGVSS